MTGVILFRCCTVQFVRMSGVLYSKMYQIRCVKGTARERFLYRMIIMRLSLRKQQMAGQQIDRLTDQPTNRPTRRCKNGNDGTDWYEGVDSHYWLVHSCQHRVIVRTYWCSSFVH